MAVSTALALLTLLGLHAVAGQSPGVLTHQQFKIETAQEPSPETSTR